MNQSSFAQYMSPNGSHLLQSSAQDQINKPKGDDYVYFNRDPSELSSDAVARATAAKLKLENYYKVAVDTAIERKTRCVFCRISIRAFIRVLARCGELERKLATIPNESKEREIRKYHRLESQYLRLKRTKIKLEDFKTVKIIGKGAFGEVCLLSSWLPFRSIGFCVIGSVGSEN
jgi:protein-serine/threonine kinase